MVESAFIRMPEKAAAPSGQSTVSRKMRSILGATKSSTIVPILFESSPHFRLASRASRRISSRNSAISSLNSAISREVRAICASVRCSCASVRRSCASVSACARIKSAIISSSDCTRSKTGVAILCSLATLLALFYHLCRTQSITHGFSSTMAAATLHTRGKNASISTARRVNSLGAVISRSASRAWKPGRNCSCRPGASS